MQIKQKYPFIEFTEDEKKVIEAVKSLSMLNTYRELDLTLLCPRAVSFLQRHKFIERKDNKFRLGTRYFSNEACADQERIIMTRREYINITNKYKNGKHGIYNSPSVDRRLNYRLYESNIRKKKSKKSDCESSSRQTSPTN